MLRIVCVVSVLAACGPNTNPLAPPSLADSRSGASSATAAPMAADGGPGWAATGPLASARSQSCAILLPTGKVLVSGGENRSGYLTTSELYDPASGRFSAAAAGGVPGNICGGVLLPSGKVLIDSDVSTALELYDPLTDSWSAAGSLSTTHSRPAMVLLSDGRALIAGGANLAVTELYDPVTGAVSQTGSLATPRQGLTLALLQDGRVLAAGGYVNSNNTEVAVAELYDPASGEWSPAAPMHQIRFDAASAVLADGRVLVTGGYAASGPIAECELYDPTTDAWTVTGAMAHSRSAHTATVLPSGEVLVVGSGDRTTDTSTELYDPATGVWSAAGNINGQRDDAPSVLLTDGQVLSAGGFSDVNTILAFFSNADLYQPAPSAVPGYAPAISGPDVMYLGCEARVAGSRFRGVSGSGGGFFSVPTAFPFVELTAGDGGVTILPGSGMSDSSVTVQTPAQLAAGGYTLTVITNAIPGSRAVMLLPDTAPTAADGAVRTAYDQPVAVALSGADADPGQSLSYAVLTSPAHGALSGSGAQLTYTPAPGYAGADSFTFQAIDDCGVSSAAATVSLQIFDAVPPAVTCPAGVTAEASSAAGALVSYPAATATDAITASPALTYSAASGSLFPLGVTPVQVTATDGAGNQASCSFTVTVRDTTPPAVSCPADLTAEATSASGARVDYPAASASDAVTAAPALSYSIASGSGFPLGNTAVQATAIDAAGNQASCSFNVTVRDTTPPALTCPGDVHALGDASGARVEFSLAATDAVTASPAIAAVPAPGSLFAPGITTVQVTATDGAGNASRCSFEVDVEVEETLRLSGGCASTQGGDGALALLGLMAAWALARGPRRRGAARATRAAPLPVAASRIARTALLASAGLLARAGSARADGFASDRFQPAPAGSDWAALDSLRFSNGAGLAPAARLDLDWAHDPLLLRTADGAVERAVLRNQTTASLGFSLALRERFRFELGVPFATFNNGEGGAVTGTLPIPASAAFGDVRLGADALLFGEREGALRLAAGVAVFLPTGSRHGYTSDGTARVVPRLSAAGDAGAFAWAAQAKLELNRDESGLAQDASTRLDLGLSAGWRVLDERLLIGPELTAGAVLFQGARFHDQDSAPVEGLLSARYRLSPDWQLGLGAGTAFTSGAGAAEPRLVASLHWTPKAPPPALASPAPAVAPPSPQPIGPAPAQPPPPAPALAPPPSLAPQFDRAIVIGTRIEFENDSARLLRQSDRALEAVLQALVEFPQVLRVEIGGHTSSPGSEEYNRALSLERAEAVRAWLVQRGVAAERLTVAGYGRSRPLVEERSEEDAAKNRRVEFRVLKVAP